MTNPWAYVLWMINLWVYVLWMTFFSVKVLWMTNLFAQVFWMMNSSDHALRMANSFSRVPWITHQALRQCTLYIPLKDPTLSAHVFCIFQKKDPQSQVGVPIEGAKNHKKLWLKNFLFNLSRISWCWQSLTIHSTTSAIITGSRFTTYSIYDDSQLRLSFVVN